MGKQHTQEISIQSHKEQILNAQKLCNTWIYNAFNKTPTEFRTNRYREGHALTGIGVLAHMGQSIMHENMHNWHSYTTYCCRRSQVNVSD